jgi:micrococcal nuclease
MKPDYTYLVCVTEVHDGDTFTGNVDLGFGIWKHGEKFRLFGLNAPELKTGEPGFKSRERLKELILTRTVLVATVKDKREKFGRMLATVFAGDNQPSINKQLLVEGLAVEFMGKVEE